MRYRCPAVVAALIALLVVSSPAHAQGEPVRQGAPRHPDFAKKVPANSTTIDRNPLPATGAKFE